MYSDLYTHSRFNPLKLLTTIAIVIVAGLGMFLFTQDSTPTRASKKALLDHQIVNMSPKQFGVFWQVDEADEGWILYGKNPKNLESIAFDERDSGGEKEKRVYHFALLRNLNPSSKYYYKIISNNEVVQSENTDIFNAQTLQESDQATSLSPMYGLAMYSNNDPASQVLSMLLIGNAHPIISVSGSTGEWLIPLQYIVDIDSRKVIPIRENDPITIQIFNDTQRSMVRSTFERSRPLPESIILGNNYSFIADSDILSAQDSIPSSKASSQTQIEVRYPKQNAVVPGVAPIIKGYGVLGEYVNIHIDSKPEFSARARVDKNGEWDIPVKTKILPGTYTLIATTKDKNGKTVQLSRRFTLIKSGEQVLGESDEATPSGTLTPSVNPSGILSLTPKLSVTVIVTTPTPTPIPPPPVSGLNIVPYVFAGVGFVVLGFGVLLLL